MATISTPRSARVTSTFDEVLVPAPRGARDQAPLPSAPRGWRHARSVAWLAAQPRERRETIFAVAFALLAGLWAPLGIVAFLARELTMFLALTLIALVALVAPRPAAVGAGASVRERVGPALAQVRRQVGPALAQARRQVGPALTRVRGQLGAAITEGRRRLGPALATARTRSHEQIGRARVGTAAAWSWVQARFEELGARVRGGIDAWGEAGARAGARSTGRDPVLSDPLSRWIGDQRTPSSTR